MVHLVIYIWISQNKYECAWNITLSSLILVHETLRYMSINFHPFHLYFALHIIFYALSTPRISEAFFVNFNLKQINFVRSKTLQTSNRKHIHKKHRTKLRVNNITFYWKQMMMFLIFTIKIQALHVGFQTPWKTIFWIMGNRLWPFLGSLKIDGYPPPNCLQFFDVIFFPIGLEVINQ